MDAVVVAEPPVVEAEMAEEAEEAEVADEDYPRQAVVAPRRFSWVTAVLYLLAILSLLGIASIPLLKGPVTTLSGPNTAGLRPPNLESSVNSTGLVIILGMVAVAVLLAVAGFLVSLLTRDFGLPALLSAYPAVILAGLLLGFLAILLVAQLQTIEKEEARIKAPQFGRPAPAGLTLSISPGQDLVIPTGAAAAATLLLTLTILLMHRSLWARIVFGCLAFLGLALGAGFIYLGSTH
jgi:hypothetical protein